MLRAGAIQYRGCLRYQGRRSWSEIRVFQAATPRSDALCEAGAASDEALLPSDASSDFTIFPTSHYA
jgi:hypothetical protein